MPRPDQNPSGNRTPPPANAPPDHRNKWRIGDYAAASQKASSAGTVAEVRGYGILVNWPGGEPEWFHWDTIARWKLPNKRKAAREAQKQIVTSPSKRKKNGTLRADTSTPHNAPGSKCEHVVRATPVPPSQSSQPPSTDHAAWAGYASPPANRSGFTTDEVAIIAKPLPLPRLH